jgi:ABC-type sugar transport system permease subunit
MAKRRRSLQAERKDIRSRWLLSAPALVIIFVAAIGPLFVMLAYSFLVKGDYGDVKARAVFARRLVLRAVPARHLRRYGRLRRRASLDLWRSVKLSM